MTAFSSIAQPAGAGASPACWTPLKNVVPWCIMLALLRAGSHQRVFIDFNRALP